MSGAEKYTEEQKDAFVQRAAEIGLGPAMKELGYPAAKPTASKWCKDRHVKIELSALQQHAAKINKWYGAQEKLTLCQKLLDECYDILMNGEKTETGEETVYQDMNGQVYVGEVRRPVTASTLSRISGVVQRTIQTMELLEGRVTDRVEQINTDTTDIELAEMIREYRARNDVKIEELRQ